MEERPASLVGRVSLRRVDVPNPHRISTLLSRRRTNPAGRLVRTLARGRGGRRDLFMASVLGLEGWLPAPFVKTTSALVWPGGGATPGQSEGAASAGRERVASSRRPCHCG